METAQEEFQIRVYLKTELAQLYAPHLDPEAALIMDITMLILLY